MTRSPLRGEHIEGVAGEPYDLNPACAAPGCTAASHDPHHLFRRTALGGPFWWVQLEPGYVTGNVVGLCRKHHDQVTVDAAWITWEDDAYHWSNLFSSSRPLSWQPPFRHQDSSTNGSEDESEAPVPAQRTLAGGENDEYIPRSYPHSPPVSAPLGGTCPTCLRPYPHKHEKREPARIRRTWSITVPKDERENGAEMLDTLLEEARRELAKRGLPYGDAEAARYFVLSTIIALFVQHAGEVLA